jgi:hypothetical protein
VALLAWAVIPFNSGAMLADINVGVLYILAISSLGFTARSWPVGLELEVSLLLGDARFGPDDLV